MAKTIEVESRGPLTAQQYKKLFSFLKKQGTFVQEKRRILIDYTTLLPGEDLRNRNLDIRARITNGIPEMIIKVGKWQGSDARKEISVTVAEGQFSALVQAYAALGYSKGVLCIRNSIVYTYKNVEFALVEVPNHSYFYEAEMVVSTDNEQDLAKEQIKNLCTELGLKLFSDQEYFDYIELLNKEANTIFDIEKDGEDYFKREFGI